MQETNRTAIRLTVSLSRHVYLLFLFYYQAIFTNIDNHQHFTRKIIHWCRVDVTPFIRKKKSKKDTALTVPYELDVGALVLVGDEAAHLAHQDETEKIAMIHWVNLNRGREDGMKVQWLNVVGFLQRLGQSDQRSSAALGCQGGRRRPGAGAAQLVQLISCLAD